MYTYSAPRGVLRAGPVLFQKVEYGQILHTRNWYTLYGRPFCRELKSERRREQPGRLAAAAAVLHEYYWPTVRSLLASLLENSPYIVTLGASSAFLILPVRGDGTQRSAEANPRQLFEENWVGWLTTFSKARCDERQNIKLNIQSIAKVRLN